MRHWALVLTLLCAGCFPTYGRRHCGVLGSSSSSGDGEILALGAAALVGGVFGAALAQLEPPPAPPPERIVVVQTPGWQVAAAPARLECYLAGEDRRAYAGAWVALRSEDGQFMRTRADDG